MTAPSHGKPKVLLVDDREANLLAFEVALRDVDCELVKMDSGRKAVEQVANHEFAAVLLDVQMPDLDGFQTSQLLRELPNGKLLPIIFITAGIHETEVFKKAYEAGAVDYLTKPIDSYVLQSKVKIFIELFQARQIIRSQTESRTFLSGDSMMAKAFREMDWSQNPLGPLDGWPQSLRTAVGIVLQSRFPMFLSWGPQQIFLYNDAYAQVLGGKHPSALGRTFKSIWGEIWDDIGPLIEKVKKGEAVYLEDLKLIMNRYGYDEETYFTFSYSPIRGEAGQVAGLHCACVETTARIKSEVNLRNALEQIEKSERTLNQIFNESPAFMAFIKGPQHVFERANQRYYEVTGRDASILGKSVAQAFPEIESQGIIKLLDEVYRTGIPYHGIETPLNIVNNSGKVEEKFFDFVYQPMVDPTGKVYGIITQGTDVTHQVLTRKKSEESDRDLRLALESARMGTWRIDLKTNVITMSQQLRELLNLPEESDHIQNVTRRGIHPEDQGPTLDRLKYAAENQTAYVNEYRSYGADGQMRWFSSRGNVVLSKTGEAVSLAGVTVDITDRKLGELALERSARLVEVMPQPFFAVDADWTINYWNPAATEVIGLETTEVLGRNLWDVFPSLRNSEFGENYERVMRDQVQTSMEAYYADFEKWFQASCFPFEDGIAVAFIDITERKRTEKILDDAKQAAERANALKSAFLANMSHEIRTPLGAMIGFADLLKDPDLEQTERWGYIDIITRNGNQLALLINDILDLSKVESGHLTFESVDTNPKRIVNEVVSLLNINAKEKGLLLRTTVEDHVPDSFLTDPVRLKQILVNIVGNAIKFTQVGSVSIRLFEQYGSSDAPRSVCFEVKDTGIGISEEKRARLFQVFSQADESITRKYGGTGLGLALSKKLANGLGGDVVLQKSSEGGGSTFLITVEDRRPVSNLKPVASEKPAEVATAQDSETVLESLRVLLIEDSPDNQMLIWHILARKGANIEIAENGIEGVSMALRGNYDIVLMDIQMPLMDGYTATLRLREQGFEKPIIALTAHAMSEIRQKCLQVGCTDHLPKPINANDLVNVISKHAVTSVPTAH